MLSLKQFFRSSILISLITLLLLPASLNSAAVAPKPKPPETPRVTPKTPEPTPEPPKVTPKPSELPKEELKTSEPAHEPPKPLLLERLFPREEKKQDEEIFSSEKISSIPKSDTEILPVLFSWEDQSKKRNSAWVDKNKNLYGEYIEIKDGGKSRLFGDPSTLNKTRKGEDIPQDVIVSNDLEKLVNALKEDKKLFHEHLQSEMSSNISESQKEKELTTIHFSFNIVTTISWEPVGFKDRFLDGEDRCFIDTQGNVYGGVIIIANVGLFGDPSLLNKDEDGQDISQKMKDFCRLIIEGGHYKLPVSDGNYRLPESDGDFKRPVSDEDFKKPNSFHVKVNDLEKEGFRVNGMISLVGADDKLRDKWESIPVRQDEAGHSITGWDSVKMHPFGDVNAPYFGEVHGYDFGLAFAYSQGYISLKELDALKTFFDNMLNLKLYLNYLIVENNQDIGMDDAISFLFQDGEVAKNSRGNFVQFKEYVDFPQPDTYRLISITNEIGGAQDEMRLLVKANAPIEGLSPRPDLWSNTDTSKKPDYYALQQRLTITNGSDSIERIYLDGDSVITRDTYYQNGVYYVTNKDIYKTFFDHVYEFINGNSGAIDRMWDTSFRPTNNNEVNGGQTATGMMWHLRPLLVENRTAGLVTPNYSIWEYAFVNTDNTNNTGKMELTEYKNSSKITHYINYVDGDGDGKFSTGEFTLSDDTFLDKVKLGFTGTRNEAYAYNQTGDSTLFSDLDEDGLNDNGNSTAVDILTTNLPTKALLSWAESNRWAYLKEDRYLVKDSNVFEVDDFPTVNPQVSSEVSSLFEKFDMERVFTSSKFGSRSIDTFVHTKGYLDADLIDLKIEASESSDQR